MWASAHADTDIANRITPFARDIASAQAVRRRSSSGFDRWVHESAGMPAGKRCGQAAGHTRPPLAGSPCGRKSGERAKAERGEQCDSQPECQGAPGGADHCRGGFPGCTGIFRALVSPVPPAGLHRRRLVEMAQPARPIDADHRGRPFPIGFSVLASPTWRRSEWPGGGESIIPAIRLITPQQAGHAGGWRGHW